MKMKLYMSVCVCLLTLVLAGLVTAQQDSGTPSAPKPEFQLETLYLVIMTNSSAEDHSHTEDIRKQHHIYWQKIADKGDLLLVGPILDPTIEAVIIFRANNKVEAVTIAANDPIVQRGMWAPSVHVWGTQKDVLKPIKLVEPSHTYYLGFLKRGEKWSPDDTPERQRIQEAHLKNIGRLHEMGKLVAAGPFLEDGDLRGIFVFKTATLEEANELTNTDPAVQAGRLRVELHPWRLPPVRFGKQ
jgi:uncharacterized protein YciI